MKSRNNGLILSYLNTVLNMIIGFFLSSFFVKMLGDTHFNMFVDLFLKLSSLSGFLFFVVFDE